MNNNKRMPIPRELFTIVVNPAFRMAGKDIATFTDKGEMQLNRQLAAKLCGKQIKVCFTEDYQHVLFLPSLESDAHTFSFGKNGIRKMREIRQFMSEKKIHFPIRYEVWECEKDILQGDALENPFGQLSEKPHGSKKK